MNRRRKLVFVLGCLLILPLVCGGLYAGWMKVRPQPENLTRELFSGIEYTRVSLDSPRRLVLHTVVIDLQADGIRVLVTPGDPGSDLPLSARTTSDFLRGNDLQLAVNGDAFEPWTSNGPLNYYPHPGDPVDVIGFAASGGRAYSDAHQETPTLYFSQDNKARFNRPFSKLYQAVSGTAMLVENGRDVTTPGDDPAPRTAIGLNRSGRQLILVIVDGRQPGYSEGVTLTELAGLMIERGAHDAMNLDGGGSSTLVAAGAFGSADVLNSPIDRGIPGWERAVGNHIGFYARESDD